ncbi:MAG: response regulator transcription factor [Bacteroidales bacterium]|nr:response regulator transcription factor [Bacteroidales bacterium]
MKTILIIEDEHDMVEGLKFNLEARNYKVITSYNGETGYRKALAEKPDLVLLDLMLPKLNGYEVCKLLKKEIPDLPIIMLTAKGQEAEIVTGLELGADDYITKPFSVLELMARINALFRRMASGIGPQEEYRFGNLEINFKKYTAQKKGKTLKLSPREYEILRFFTERQGEIVTREELLKQIWNYDSYPDTRTVDAHIAKLRHKIEENPEEPKLIVTVHGMGYKLL